MYAFNMCVCNTITFEIRPRKSIFGTQVYLQGIQIKFVYEGHRVKVKVTACTIIACCLQGCFIQAGIARPTLTDLEWHTVVRTEGGGPRI